MMRIVKSILFDAVHKGILYKDLNLGYTEEDGITESYIGDEDGPWGMVQIGSEMIDFQIYTNPDNGEVCMQSCLMFPSSHMVEGVLELCWSHGEWVEAGVEITNIRVDYAESN